MSTDTSAGRSESSTSAQGSGKHLPVDLTTALTVTLQSHLQLLNVLSNPLTDRHEQLLLNLGQTLPEPVLRVSKNKSAGLAGDLLTLARLIKAMTRLGASRRTLDQCLAKAQRVSHKKTRELESLQKQLRGLKSEIAWPLEAPVSRSYQALLDSELALETLVENNSQFQAELLRQTEEQIEQLGKLLDAGNSAEAEATWNRIHGNIDNLGGQTQHQLNQRLTSYRAKINELRDWKKFAAAEKKKELIEAVQKLHESECSPPEKARQIRKLHESWKKLGFSSQNEQLWQKFKEASDQAYAPCKEYFKQQKAHMADNLKNRLAICDRLEKQLATLDLNTVKLVELKTLEKQAQEEWKQFAPVEQSKVKRLQKRFYGLLNQFREIRRSEAKANGELKQQLVLEARKLSALEDRREAIDLAKKLQARWKTIGPSFAREDRKYWSDFRAACDVLFKEQEQARKTARSEITQAVNACKETLRKLEALFELDDETLRESRNLFVALQNEFNQALSARIKKERQQLQQQFNLVTRKIEVRFRKLPDKKLQRALTALRTRAEKCTEFENRLLECDNDDGLQQEIAGFDQSAWKELPDSGIQKLDKAMESRLQTLLATSGLSALEKLVARNDQQARRLLVAAEIKANVESPEQDSGLRMELQLNQLQNRFGKAPVEETGAREHYAREFELDYLCLGPLSRATRRSLDQRASAVIDRLL